jgi:CubicO group peptidase (beta-lactamase class C family)
MDYKIKVYFKIILIVILTTIPCHYCIAKSVDTPKSVFDTTKFINGKREYLKQFIKQENIDGLGIGFFTNDKIIWKEYFGKSTYNKPINDSTLFAICSLSKNFTALAVMNAVQDGLVDLDIPIKNYLQDFRINSCYEEHPEEKITLRMLLSHTAGYTTEAPLGNSFDYRCKSKQEHWNSINDTWLKFPVNTSFSYSNSGFDLAAEVIEKVSGMSFETYLRKKIFVPLGMQYSTVDDSVVLSNKNRTEGDLNPFVKKTHKKIPQIGAGGVYSSITEMVKFIQFQMNHGIVNEEQILEKRYILETYKVNRSFYGLGIGIDSANNSILLSHRGEGFGYASSMAWFPEYNIGCVILGNKPCNYNDIAYNLMVDFINNNEKIKKDSSLVLGYIPVFKVVEQENPKKEFIYPNNKNEVNKINIVGKYEVILDMTEAKWFAKIAAFLGVKVVKFSIKMYQGNLIMDGVLGKYELKEYIPGLYFTEDGEAFDIRNEIPTFRNIKLRKYSNK